jgi:queuine/archaeosine tRNA-ribosyltransferase
MVGVFKVEPTSHLRHRFSTEVEGVMERETRGYSDFTRGWPIVNRCSPDACARFSRSRLRSSRAYAELVVLHFPHLHLLYCMSSCLSSCLYSHVSQGKYCESLS